MSKQRKHYEAAPTKGLLMFPRSLACPEPVEGHSAGRAALPRGAWERGNPGFHFIASGLRLLIHAPAVSV